MKASEKIKQLEERKLIQKENLDQSIIYKYSRSVFDDYRNDNIATDFYDEIEYYERSQPEYKKIQQIDDKIKEIAGIVVGDTLTVYRLAIAIEKITEYNERNTSRKNKKQ